MLRNHLKVALRNIWKQKLPALINIFGLSTGIACAVVAFVLRSSISPMFLHLDREPVYRFILVKIKPEGV